MNKFAEHIKKYMGKKASKCASRMDWEFPNWETETIEDKIEWLYTHNKNYNNTQYDNIWKLRETLKGSFVDYDKKGEKVYLNKEDIENILYYLKHHNKNYHGDQYWIIDSLKVEDFLGKLKQATKCAKAMNKRASLTKNAAPLYYPNESKTFEEEKGKIKVTIKRIDDHNSILVNIQIEPKDPRKEIFSFDGIIRPMLNDQKGWGDYKDINEYLKDTTIYENKEDFKGYGKYIGDTIRELIEIVDGIPALNKKAQKNKANKLASIISNEILKSAKVTKKARVNFSEIAHLPPTDDTIIDWLVDTYEIDKDKVIELAKNSKNSSELSIKVFEEEKKQKKEHGKTLAEQLEKDFTNSQSWMNFKEKLSKNVENGKLEGIIDNYKYRVRYNLSCDGDLNTATPKIKNELLETMGALILDLFNRGYFMLPSGDISSAMTITIATDDGFSRKDLLSICSEDILEKEGRVVYAYVDVSIDLKLERIGEKKSSSKTKKMTKKAKTNKLASIIKKEINKSAKVNKKAIAESEYFDIIEVDENGETIDIIESDYTNGVSAVIEKAKEEAVDGKHIIVVNRYTELDEDGNEFVNDDLNETMWDSEKDIDKYGVIFYDKYEGVDNVAIVDTEEKAKEVLKMLNELEDIEDETEREIMWEDINNMVNNYKERFSREIENSNGFYKGIKFINYNDKVKPSVY